MAFMDFIKKQFIDVIHWTEETDGVLPIAIRWRTSKSRTARS